jgi:predicted esterase
VFEPLIAQPCSLTCAAPASQPPTNILILLHGLGDTNASFTRLGQQLNLPETACIALQAPNALIMDIGGFQWGDDLVMDQRNGELDMDASYATVSLANAVTRHAR